ncbi:MAG: hypothetical protein JW795_08800, partial [Chitinivibrionales bacterium]|nr:hypothetical protein [Chitinivibrionales bacterium]
QLQISEWVPESRPPDALAAAGTGATGTASGGSGGGTYSSAGGTSNDEELNRNLRRIQNIMSMQISPEEKIKQLNRIEMEAQRNIVLEEEKIKELKEKM